MNKVIQYDYIDKEQDTRIYNLLTPAGIGPQWYKDIKPTPHAPTTRTCASFVELFKNSMLFVAPGDFWIEFTKDGFDSGGDEISEAHIALSSHTLFEGVDQLGEFDKGFVNVKIDTNVIIRSAQDRMDAIFMDTFYWNTRPRYRAAQGILPIIDNKEVQLNVNLWVPKIVDRIEFKAGEPIAMLYFPLGIPKFEREDIELQERYEDVGEYLNWMGECPYGYGK